MTIKISTAARLLLGLIYLVFGLNGFLNFLPMKIPPMPEAATAFMAGMMKAGYFFPLLKGTEVVGGFLLLSGFAAPLALVVLAPVTLNIFLFHACLTPGLNNLILPLVMGLLHVGAACSFWRLYTPLFSRGN